MGNSQLAERDHMKPRSALDSVAHLGDVESVSGNVLHASTWVANERFYRCAKPWCSGSATVQKSVVAFSLSLRSTSCWLLRTCSLCRDYDDGECDLREHVVDVDLGLFSWDHSGPSVEEYDSATGQHRVRAVS